MRAAYATNVAHYDHVLEAMSRTFGDITLIRRPEPTPQHYQALERLGAPQGILRMVNRRVRQPSQVGHSARLLGMGDLALTAAVQAGRRLPPPLFRQATVHSARRVAKIAAKQDVLHFVEGLGHYALARNEYQLAICERRAMHHAVFEGDFPAVGAFPHKGRRDPIGDLLDMEYQAATKILVYSNAAKRSFLERGFADEKIVVAPLGVPLQLPRVEMQRDKYKLAFVGRGDVYKGLDLAVAAVEKLGAPYRLHVAGPMRAEVREWMTSKPHVIYEGLLDKFQLRELYSSSHLLVLPSIEAFGLAVAEAFHHGLHAVCLPETGITEYLPVDSYTRISGRDPEEWASVLSGLINSGIHLDFTGKAETDPQGVVTWESAARQLKQIYERNL